MSNQKRLNDINESEPTDEHESQAFRRYKNEEGSANVTRASWSGAEVPGGWTSEIIGDHIEVLGGKAFSSDDFSTESDEGTPLVKRKTVNNRQYPETNLTVDFDSRYTVKNGDLLVSMDRYFECMIWPYGDAALNQRVCRLNTLDKFNSRFLSYALQKPLKYLEDLGGTTDFTSLSINEFDHIELPTPPIDEQHKIASILLNIERAVQKTNAIIERTERVKEGLKSELLTGGIEQEQVNKEGTPPTELGDLPTGWESILLDDVATNEENAFVDGPFGSNLKKEEYVEDGFARLIQLQNIEEGKFINDTKRYISRGKFEDLNRHAAFPGDLAVAKMAEPVARACIVPSFEDRYLVVADCIKLSVDTDRFNPQFVMYCLNSYWVWRQAFARSRGSTRKRINLTQLKQVKIPYPPLEEQEEIVAILSDIDNYINHAIKHKSILNSMKRGLRQDLVSGKVRTEDANIKILQEVAQHD